MTAVRAPATPAARLGWVPAARVRRPHRQVPRRGDDDEHQQVAVKRRATDTWLIPAAEKWQQCTAFDTDAVLNLLKFRKQRRKFVWSLAETLEFIVIFRHGFFLE